MKRALLAKAVALILCLATFGPAPRAESTVTVFAAASTAPAIEEISELYEANGRGRLRTVFASSGALARQIYNGAPADIFISANPEWMAWLVAQGTIEGEPVPLLGNSLVLVQPAESDTLLKLDYSLPEMLQGRPLAIGNPDHVPAGAYARDALSSLGLWDAVAPLAVRTSDVRAALFLVTRGEAAAAIVYESDLESGRGVRLAARFPRESHPPIVYPAAVVADGNRDAARELLDYLAGPEAGTVFRRYGFRTE